MTLPDNDALAKLMADANQRENSMLAFKATDALDLMSQDLAAEVIALRQEVAECDANINIKADFIEATMNQLAASDEVIGALRKRVEAADALACAIDGRRPRVIIDALYYYRATVTP